ncbi:MAG TPA: UDP-3-O-(3-hydroxymyristoyl)glucosamine N-acyltransferase, partial [Flavobacteriaceae bacterium]
TLWGQVGIISGITIGKKAVLMAQSGATKSLEGGKTYWGTPAQDVKAELKVMASIRQLPKILEELRKK